jgi:hypothetical protein
LVYSTYLGGSGDDRSNGIAVDSAGNAYITGVTGFTGSANFPITPGAFQTTCNNCAKSGDAFVAKINSSGSALAYSTYLGGRDYDWGFGIAVDSSGNAYVTGSTYSYDFPVTPGAFQTQCNHGSGCANVSDAFVTKLNPTGSALVYSTYLGGGRYDEGQAIVVDSAGTAYVTGQTNSTNFPKTNPSCGGSWDAFVTRLNATGSALVYSTCLGGSGTDWGWDIAVDHASNAYVTGLTQSTNFPTKHPLQAAYGGGNADVFVTKIPMLAVTTTTLTSSPNPSTHGQAVTFTATVTSKLGAPHDGETVTFKKGKTVLGTGALTGGSASFTTSMLPVGTNYIKAVYGGDSTLASSTSKVLQQVVN